MVVSDDRTRFVPARGSASGLRAATLEEHVRYCLRAAILTRRGERVREPQIGSLASSFLWRPLESSLRLDLESAVRQAVEQGEPRVKLEAVDVENDAADASRLKVQLRYRLLANNKRDRLEVAL